MIVNLNVECAVNSGRIPTVGESAETAHDLKEAKSEFQINIDRIVELARATQRAAEDIKARKSFKAEKQTRAAQKAEQEVAKKARAASDAAVKAQKAKAKAKVAAAKKAAKKQGEAVEGAAAPWTILSVRLKGHSDVAVVDVSEFAAKDMDWELPFKITNVDLTAELAPHESIFNVWMNGFDRNETVIQKGRAWWTLGGCVALRDAINRFLPDNVVLEIESGNANYNATLTQTNIFGYAAHMRSSGGEQYSMASLRWQKSGSRSIICVNVANAVAFLKDEADPPIDNPTPVDISNMLKFADGGVIQSLRAHGTCLHYSTIKPNEMVFTPMGWWVVEAPLNMERNFGVHTPVILKVASDSNSMKGYDALMHCKTTSLPDGAVKEKTVKCPCHSAHFDSSVYQI